MVSLVCEEVVDVAIYSSLFEFSPLIILILLQFIDNFGCKIFFIILWEVLKVVL